MAGPVTDLMEFDTKIKDMDQKKRDRQTNQTLSQTTQNLNESTYGSQPTMRDTSMVSEADLVPSAKRALDKAEYDRRKIEEEEMKRIIEEERQKQLDAYGGVDDNLQAIPL